MTVTQSDFSNIDTHFNQGDFLFVFFLIAVSKRVDYSGKSHCAGGHFPISEW